MEVGSSSCPFCPYTSSNTDEFLRHYVKKHRDAEGFLLNCKVCLHPFSTVAGLKSHIRRGNHGPSNLSGNVENIGEQSTSTEESTAEGNANETESFVRVHLEDSTEQEICPFVTVNLRTDDENEDSSPSRSLVLEDEDTEDYMNEADSGHTKSDSSGSTINNPLMSESAKFLLHLREEGMVSHTAIEKAADGVDDLFSKFSDAIKDKILNGVDKETGAISEEHINTVFQEFNSSIFDGVNTKTKLDAFMQSTCDVFSPIQVELDRTHSTDSKGILTEEPHYAYVSPFLPSLKRFLSRPDILECILSSHSPDGTIGSYKDGSYSKSHPILKEDGTVGVILCYDELEISSPLGPAKHKLALYYWTLANLPPHMRSSLRSVCLLGIAWSRDLKPNQKKSRTTSVSFDLKYEAHCKILQDFLEGLKLLEKGIEIPSKIGNVMVRGTLLFVTGDTPAVGTMGGFKARGRQLPSAVYGGIYITSNMCNIGNIDVLLCNVSIIK